MIGVRGSIADRVRSGEDTVEQRVEQKICKIDVTEKERKLIDLIRVTGYGEIVILVQNTEPVRVEEVKRSIKL
jgi:hypothetical protein